jgi:glycosyltransferase involved in cell wall biosynthesis
VPNVDVYLVHREVLPVGPPVVELTLARQQGRSLVYDFDDAIYLPNVSEANRFVRGLKWPSKVPRIIGAADRVIAGNGYLARYAGIRNPRVTVIPTAVDTTRFVPRAGEGPAGSRPVLGWIGSPTTVRYMSELREILASLAARFSFTVRVAGGGRAIAFPGVAIDNVAWTPATEVSLFNTCDIGIYPLTDDAWTRGKCGFKAIQFMACGVPVIASAVGVNREIIQDGVTGFLASTETEWTEKLGWLLADPRLREKLGHAGRCAVEERYSLARHAPALAAVLRDSAGVRR